MRLCGQVWESQGKKRVYLLLLRFESVTSEPDPAPLEKEPPNVAK